MWGERFPCQYRLIRLVNSIIFGVARRLPLPSWPRRPWRPTIETREAQLRALCGPSRRLWLTVVIAVLVLLLAVLHLTVLLLHGPIFG